MASLDDLSGKFQSAQKASRTEIQSLKSEVTRLRRSLVEAHRAARTRKMALAQMEEKLEAEKRRHVIATYKKDDTAAPSDPSALTEAYAHQIYEVQSGDTLSKIAIKRYNDSSKWEQIYKANRKTIRDPKNLKVGQELILP